MPNEEIKRPASSFRNAGKGRVIGFVDENGVPSVKDEFGVTTPSATLDGTPVPLDEQGSDRGFLFTKDVSGVTEVFYMDDAGQVSQITDNGALAAKSLFFDGAVKVNVPILSLIGGSANNIFSTITVPPGTNTILSGKGFIHGGTAGPGQYIGEFLFSVARASSGKFVGGSEVLASPAVPFSGIGSIGLPAMSISVSGDGSSPALSELELRTDAAAGTTEIFATYCYKIDQLTLLVPEF